MGQTEQKVPDQVYPDLEYVLSLVQSSADLEPEQLSELIKFVSSMPAESGMKLKERKGASGAFYAFTVRGDFADVLDYVYNPDIPLYVTMPSSLRQHEWLTPEVTEALVELPRLVESADDIRLLRGRDREVITPDTNTGGYYKYNQERVVTVLPGPAGPVLISVSSQNDLSEVGKKGCIVGDDKDWNYLYSNETGLNKTGMGWVDSYMYYAHSVLIYVVDSSSREIRMGSFKWLNAGWATMNMVKSSHILKGIKRFASDFKAVIEAPGLPSAPVLADKYRELQQTSEESLQQMVSAYLEALTNDDASGLDSSFFKRLISSGKYLKQMSNEELVKVLLLEYVKGSIGKKSLNHFASHSM
ncbi:MAG: hypothetical protein GY799_16695 [Desulfobulbaceae bacterium]|nr:hypothetical protein [Desulfobulbaceae bacterium]